jgi:hypothetical protein
MPEDAEMLPLSHSFVGDIDHERSDMSGDRLPLRHHVPALETAIGAPPVVTNRRDGAPFARGSHPCAPLVHCSMTIKMNVCSEVR